MTGISDKVLKTGYTENKYRFNDGSELQNKEFIDWQGSEDIFRKEYDESQYGSG